MATKTWIGADTSWNTAGNWDPSGVPGAGDDVVFDNVTAQACTLDVNAVCASLVNTTYAGTFTLGAYTLTIGGNFTFNSGTFVPNSSVITVGGNWDTSGLAAEFAEATCTIVMTGTSKTMSVSYRQDFYKLTINGSVVLTAGSNSYVDFISGGLLTVANGASLDLASSGSGYECLRATSASITVNPTGIITNSGGSYINMARGTGVFSGGGTVNARVDFRGGTKIGAATYAGGVRATDSSSSAQTITAGTGASQTITINGNLEIAADGTNNTVLDAATYDPNIVVTGYIDFIGTGEGSEIILAGDGDWNVAGTIDLTGGALTPGLSEFICDGASQAITSDTESFYDLTCAPTSAGGICFMDNADIDGTLKCWTPNAAIDTMWAVGITVTINAIDLDGQAAGTRIYIRAAGTSAAYKWIVTTNTQCDFVRVSYNNAGDGIEIVATNSLDEGNNTNWDFPGAGGVTHEIFVSDAFSMDDAVGRQADYSRSVADAVVMQDAVARTVAYYRSAGDAITIQDAVARTVAYYRSVGDAMVMTDAATLAIAGAALEILAGDAMTMQDAVQRAVAYYRSMADALQMTDAATLTPGHYTYPLLPTKLPEFLDPPLQ